MFVTYPVRFLSRNFKMNHYRALRVKNFEKSFSVIKE